MSGPTIAAVISTYNSPEYLRRVLAGFASQSDLPDQLIVADDGSTEETARVVTEFAARASFPVRHVWHEDRGFRLAEIRNRAIAAAIAEYLVFTDGDCIPHPCFIRDHRKICRRGHFVTGKRMLIGKELAPDFSWQGAPQALLQGMSGKISGLHHLVRAPWFVLPRQGVTGLRGCNMAMFRDDLLAVNGFNERITGWGREDSEIVARLFLYGLRRIEPPFAALVFHLWHPENSRSSLETNESLLNQTLQSGYFRCELGIEKPRGSK